MDMLDDISKELPTNGMKVADLISAFNMRLGYVSTALAQLDKRRDAIDAKLEKKLDEQDRKLDELAAFQARSPTRADLVEMQKAQLLRETYEISHQVLVTQIAAARGDIASLQVARSAEDARVGDLLRAADKTHADQNLALKSLEDRAKVSEGAITGLQGSAASMPSVRRSQIALVLTALGIFVALSCSGLGTLLTVVELVLHATGH
jgi:septal ring factor EnvC (AmiA/AmiB activator)